jgi:hypothetical protein
VPYPPRNALPKPFKPFQVRTFSEFHRPPNKITVLEASCRAVTSSQRRSMGLTFRGAEYHRKTWWTKRTVKDGEACVIWSLGGKSKEVIGPKRVQTW